MNLKYFLILMAVLCLVGCGGKKKEIKIGEVPEKPLEIDNIKIILENSGSMRGYFNGTKFKKTISDLAAELDRIKDNKCKELVVKKINSYTFSDQLELTPFANNTYEFCTKINNSVVNFGKTSPMDEFVKYLVDSTNGNNVYVLVSDFVIDKKGENVLPTLESKFSIIFNEARKKNLAVLIYRFTSEFTGEYMPALGMKQQISNVIRPYYVWMIGPNKQLALLANLLDGSNVVKPENQVVMGTNNNKIIPEVLVLSNRLGTWRFEDSLFYNVESKRSKLRFTVGLDLSKLPIYYKNTDYLSKITKYNSNIIKIDSVKYYYADEFSNKLKGRESNLANKFTHFAEINITGEVEDKDMVEIYWNNELPEWVDKFSTDDDSKITDDNLSKTFAIKYIIRGIHESYRKCENFYTKYYLEN
jgi:hypothetical protein